MSLLSEGTWPCTVLSATFGEDDKGSPNVQISVRIDEGPSAGRQCTYEDQVNTKSALYVGRSCKAVGWRGGSMGSLKTDCAAWIEKTGGRTTVEVRHIEVKKGKKWDKWIDGGRVGPAPVWDKVNSVGSGPRVLAAPSTARLADADEAMRRAMAADGGAPDDVPHAATGADGDDIPFLTCSSVGLGEIAAVLR